MPKGRTAAAPALAVDKAKENGDRPGSGYKQPLVKTTLFIPDVIDANLAYMSLQTQQSKAELVRQAVEQYLDRNHYDPSKKPKLSPPSYD